MAGKVTAFSDLFDVASTLRNELNLLLDGMSPYNY